MFRQALQGINERTEGALGSLIMGVDGISVEKVMLEGGAEANIDVAAAEVTSLVRSAQRAGRDIGLGGVRELILSYQGLYLVARMITTDYFVVLALSPEGNLGRGRFELRKAELDLAREFAI